MLENKQTFEENFKNMPVLSSSRLILKKIGPQDYSSIIDITMYDGESCKDESDVKNIITKINTDIINEKSLHWGIFLKESSQLVGVCGYYRGFENNCGEIGYVINTEYQGNGFMSEAVSVLCEFGSVNLKLDFIFAYTDEKNFSSQSVLKKNNFINVSIDKGELKYAYNAK